MTPMVANPTDDTCPGCGATVQVWTCAACTVVNPTVRVVLAVVALLPTPQQRTAAFLATLRTEVARRSGKEHTR